MPQRLSVDAALELYRHSSLHELGAMAHAVTLARHPEPWRTYVIDRNINYSNVCVAGCAFCNFKVAPGDGRAFLLGEDAILKKIQQLVDIGGTQVLMQGGLHPDLGLDWFVSLLATIKQHYPAIHLHALSPPEIDHLARMENLSISQTLGRLRDAGLDSLPGGGAEILVDRVRRAVSPGKCDAATWLEVMRQAHRLGLGASATMMFGHVETDAERIEHLQRLRQLQDETGGFVAFICWTFCHESTPLARVAAEPDGGVGPLRLAGAVEYLRTLALARLFLDNFDNVQSSWVTQGEKIGQLALFFGANDMGSVMMEENVVSSAGATFRLDEAAIRHLIRSAGWTPRQRNQRYELVEQTGLAARAERGRTQPPAPSASPAAQ